MMRVGVRVANSEMMGVCIFSALFCIDIFIIKGSGNSASIEENILTI